MGAGIHSFGSEEERGNQERKDGRGEVETFLCFRRNGRNELKHHHARSKSGSRSSYTYSCKEWRWLDDRVWQVCEFRKIQESERFRDAIDCTRFSHDGEQTLHKKKFSNTDCDMTHTKCRSKGEKLTYEFLEKALPSSQKLTKRGGWDRVQDC